MRCAPELSSPEIYRQSGYIKSDRFVVSLLQFAETCQLQLKCKKSLVDKILQQFTVLNRAKTPARIKDYLS